jgi:hypothetical protein
MKDLKDVVLGSIQKSYQTLPLPTEMINKMLLDWQMVQECFRRHEKVYLVLCGCGNPTCPPFVYQGRQRALDHANDRDGHDQQVFEIKCIREGDPE